MSFALHHQRLFSVSVRDDSDNKLAGFTFTPAPDTKKRLNNHQLIYRRREGGFEVYYRTNPRAAEPLLGPISNRVRFTYLMKMTDGDFFQRHEPDLTKQTGPQIYLDNLSSIGDILPGSSVDLTSGTTVQTPDAVKTHPTVFAAYADVSGVSPPTQVRIVDKFDPGNVLATVPIVAPNGGDQGAAKIDLDELSLPAGPYTLKTNAVGAVSRTAYINDEVAAARVQGVLDIHWETPQNTGPAGGGTFVTRFKKR